jgi:hypothetical protein
VIVFPATRPADFDKQAIIKRMAHELPQYSVFDSGGSKQYGSTWITVMNVVSTAEIESHATEILAAARLFREQATDLMTRLAQKLGASPENTDGDPESWCRFPQSGDLDAEWMYWFHGMECEFRNRQTGQTIDVCLGFAGEFGALAPYFFVEFIKSTPGMEHLGRVLKNSFHDGKRALQVLGDRGDLKMLENTVYGLREWAAVTVEE